jgi:glycosyltransferase involved in cell wall biosynthesis
VGHLYPGRGIETILECARRLVEVDFIVVGGNASDVKWWRNQTDLANVTFLGHRPHSQVTDIYESFDVVLAPYQRKVMVAGGRTDTSRWMSPLKIFEYMASGAATVASDLPVLREVLRHEENALLVDPEDMEGWEEAVCRLLDDRALHGRITSTALRQVTESYTWPARARLVLSGFGVEAAG